MEGEIEKVRPGFTELLLLGVILLILTGTGIGIALYVIPSERLQIPELQPSVRVTREADLPVGGSRVVNWGDRIILLVRSGEQEYFALNGVSPVEGCILRWDPDALRVVSPCGYLVYDSRGNVVAGLTTTPLSSYAVVVRDGAVYVTEPYR